MYPNKSLVSNNSFSPILSWQNRHSLSGWVCVLNSLQKISPSHMPISKPLRNQSVNKLFFSFLSRHGGWCCSYHDDVQDSSREKSRAMWVEVMMRSWFRCLAICIVNIVHCPGPAKSLHSFLTWSFSSQPRNRVRNRVTLNHSSSSTCLLCSPSTLSVIMSPGVSRKWHQCFWRFSLEYAGIIISR